MRIEKAGWARRIGFFLSLTACLPVTDRILAADLQITDFPHDGAFAAPRYFPRGDGIESDVRASQRHPAVTGCQRRRVAVPTNAPDDPSYVGSEYGLAKPSYYGFTPPRGIDDPYGRPLLAYCR